MTGLVLGIVLIGNATTAAAEKPQGAQPMRGRLDLVAKVRESPPEITLSWTVKGPYRIYRRAGDCLWDDHAGWGEPIVHSREPGSEWTDTKVSVGAAYEYRLEVIELPDPKSKVPQDPRRLFGFLLAGIRHDRTGPRGDVYLVYDQTQGRELGADLDLLVRDLIGDGWRVVQVTIHAAEIRRKTAGSADIRAALRQAYRPPPVGQLAVLFLLGDVPVHHSGLGETGPDTHFERTFPMGCDVFYADLDGLWTDVGTFRPEQPPPQPGSPVAKPTIRDGTELTAEQIAKDLASNRRPTNLPGDGITDQAYTPPSPAERAKGRVRGQVEMAFGRVSFGGVTQFKDATGKSLDEVALLRRYLRKNHAYRHKQFTIQPRFQAWAGPDWANIFLRDTACSWYGRDSMNVRFASFDNRDPFKSALENGGTFANIGRVGWVVADYLKSDTLATQGSNCFLFTAWLSGTHFWWSHGHAARWVLGGEGQGLFYLSPTLTPMHSHHGGLGWPMGMLTWTMANNERTYPRYHDPDTYRDAHPPEWWHQRTFNNLMGDPTLRVHQVAPPQQVKRSTQGLTTVLTWNAPDEPHLIGFQVSGADAINGPWRPLTAQPISATMFSLANAPRWLHVRAVVRTTSGSGTYLNPSQGILVER